MKRFVWLGVLLSGSAIWAVSLFVSRYFAAPQPEVNMILSTLAVGAPAFFLALAADRMRLRRPLLLCVAAYCLGSAVATGVLHSLEAPDGATVGRSLEAGVFHAGSLTLFVPSDRGFVLAWANALWLAVAGLVASISLEALAPKGGSGRSEQKRPGDTKPDVNPSRSTPRSLRPRRRPRGGNGTERGK